MTGPTGGWRKTIIDKSIAYVLTPYSSSEDSKVLTSDGPLNMVHVLQAILACTTMSVNCSTKVIHPEYLSHLFSLTLNAAEGAFESAEIHLLASGQRDSARLLAEMFIQWSSASGAYGVFALRGVIP